MNLFVKVYEDGGIDVKYLLQVEPPGETNLTVFGEPKFLLVVNRFNEPLDYNLINKTLFVTFIESKEIIVTYTVDEYVNVTGGLITFHLPRLRVDKVTVKLPNSSIIYDLNPLPNEIYFANESITLVFTVTPLTIEYTIPQLNVSQPIITPSRETPPPQDLYSYVTLSLPIILTISAVVIVLYVSHRFKRKISLSLTEEEREVISFLKGKGGAAYQSEIREGINLPVSTAWRRVKRLEEKGIVEIIKTPRGNLVRLK